MKNTYVAKVVKEKLENLGYEIDFVRILADLDVAHNDDIKKNEIDVIVDAYLSEFEYEENI